MPVKRLPASPSLDHLRYQAKDLRRAHAAHELAAAQRLREFHPAFHRASDVVIFEATLSLSDAQLAIAREYGFQSWARLKRHIEQPALSDRLDLPHDERIQDVPFRRAVNLLDSGDVEGLRAHLLDHPGLIRQRVVFEGGNYFHNPTLLEFAAENPVRRGKLPRNIVDVMTVILDAGPEQSAIDETLMLVATGSVPRECRVQVALLRLLCDRGADPNTAIHAAALHGEFGSVEALLGCGARIDLPVAAALGRAEEFQRLLSNASAGERHLALTLAADHGHAEIVRMLLDSGENPNRYNPLGGHSHTTPLHQAAGAGNEDVVRLLVERGAKLDMKDLLWQATPVEWAMHAGKTEIEAYLRSAGSR